MTDSALAPRRMSPLVSATCERLIDRTPSDVAAQIREILGRLQGPLQLAVAGRIKSGKSTVVNGLIGRRVSPTDIRECTRMVTRFRYGTVDRVEVRKLDGTTLTLPYDDDGVIPADLGCEPHEVAVVDAYLTYEMLRHVTIIDTPGLASLDARSVGRTQGMLGDTGGVSALDGVDEQSQIAVSSAEAVLYVLTQSVRADDAEALNAFRRASSGQTSSPINALAILNKADQVTADEPMQAAIELAREHSHTLRHAVSQVLPLVGLVAESTGTGYFSEADAQTLRAVATLDEATRQMMFMSTDLFMRPEVGVDPDARERLLIKLDLYGIRTAIDAILGNRQISTGELRTILESASGYPKLRAVIDGVFSVRADDIKSAVALSALDSLAAKCAPGPRDLIYDALEELYQHPEAQQLRLLEAATLVTSGRVDLPEDMFDEVRNLVTGTNPGEMLGTPSASSDELITAALEGAGRWRSFATFGSNPTQSRIAHIIHRSYFLIWQQLRAPNTGGAIS